MTRIGYLRVSTQDQNLDRQRDALAVLCDEMHEEQISAAAPARPVFEAVLKRLEPGDTLVVLTIDRAFRSTVDAVNQVEKLMERGVRIKIANLDIDTATADGLFAFTIIAAVATHERMRISERTKEGLAAARRRGKRLGRPSTLSEEQLARAREKIDAGDRTISEIAEAHGIWPWSLSRALKRIETRS